MATILITGTNRGLGLEFVSQYLNRGDQVIATCRSIDTADELRELQMSHTALQLMEVDLRKKESIDSFAAAIKSESIDIFISNAGVYGPRDGDFGQVTARNWLPVLEVNTIAPLILTQVLIENLRRGKDRKLVYITSRMGSIAENNGGGSYIYRSSKTALNQVVKSLAVDLADEGFIAAVLHPGWVLTDMGGPNAMIDPDVSVKGMIAVIDSLKTSMNGKFFAYDGQEIPW
ncbi:MAG: SDR family oxidoreductase [Pseudohongiellaceae bacterium]